MAKASKASKTITPLPPMAPIVPIASIAPIAPIAPIKPLPPKPTPTAQPTQTVYTAHEFQRMGLAYIATDVSLRKAGSEGDLLAHWLHISGLHWYRPLAMRGYAVPWFFLHDAGIITLWGQSAIRPHPSALSWSAAQQAAYDDYAAYLGRLSRTPLIDSTRRWLHDLGSELTRRGHSDESRARAEVQVILACLEWLLDTIEPAIGWRRLSAELRWRDSSDAEITRTDPLAGLSADAIAANLRKGLTPRGENAPERPFINFLRQVIGTGELLWRPVAGRDTLRRRWFNEIAIRAASDYHGAVRTIRDSVRDSMAGAGSPLNRVIPEVAIRTRALRPLDVPLIERYLNRRPTPPDEQIHMELDMINQEQVVDMENPLRTFVEGLNGITRRGPLSAMLRRELADDDLFYAKFADNSLLYLSRPEMLSVPFKFFMGILVDTTLSAAMPDGSSSRSVAKELALYLLDTARLIPTVAPGLPTDAYLFQFSDQGAEYQRAQPPELVERFAQLGLNAAPTPQLNALAGEFVLNLDEPPDDLQDPWLLRADVLAASYFNLTTIPRGERPPIRSWDTNGVVYPNQPPHTWDISTAMSAGSELRGQVALRGGDSALLTITKHGDSDGEHYVVTRGRPVMIQTDLLPATTYRVSLSASGLAATTYRLNLRLTPGARALSVGPHIWPAVSRLVQVAGQRLAERGALSERESAYSLAHVALITSDAFTGEAAEQIQRFIRAEFEALSRQVAIHIFRLSPSNGTVDWLLDRGQYRMMKPPQPETLDTLRGQSKIRIQFWRELRRDLQGLGHQ